MTAGLKVLDRLRRDLSTRKTLRDSLPSSCRFNHTWYQDRPSREHSSAFIGLVHKPNSECPSARLLANRPTRHTRVFRRGVEVLAKGQCRGYAKHKGCMRGCKLLKSAAGAPRYRHRKPVAAWACTSLEVYNAVDGVNCSRRTRADSRGGGSTLHDPLTAPVTSAAAESTVQTFD